MGNRINILLKWLTPFFVLGGFLFFAGAAEAANYYWVGGTGNWSDAANHWALTTGGAGQANIPPIAGSIVIFDANSGTGTCYVDADVANVARINMSSSSGMNLTINAGVNFTISNVGGNIVQRTITNNGNATVAVGGAMGPGPWVQGENSTLTIVGTAFPITTLTASATGNTVIYKNDSAVSIKGSTYYDLRLADGATLTADRLYSLSSSVTVNHVITIGQSTNSFVTTLSTGAFALILAGSGTPLVFNSYSGTPTGTLSDTNSNIQYTGTSATNITPATYYYLILNKAGTTFTATGPTNVIYYINVMAGTLDPAGYQFTGVGTNSISIKGTLIVDGATFENNYSSFESYTTLAGGIVNYTRTGDQAINNAVSYKNLSISGTGIKTLAGDTTVGENLSILAGNLATGNYNLDVAGNWINGVGVGGFGSDNGTVNFNGANQKIFGATNFYNFTKDISGTSADTLMFQNTYTQAILASGTLTLKGAPGKILTIRSCDAAGTQSDNSTWLLNVSGTGTVLAVDYVDVKDSDASAGKQIVATNSIDGSGNLNWSIPAANVAPTLTSTVASASTIKGGSLIGISLVGQGDSESAGLQLFCNETGSPTLADNICSEAGTNYASPYGTMGCTYNVATGNESRITYCRVFDGTDYSTERTVGYAVDSLAPSAPVADPIGGIYISAQSVNLASDAGATVYYTTNGSNPTNSSAVYSGAIDLSSSAILKAIAIDAVGNESAVMTEDFVLNLPTPTSTPSVVSVITTTRSGNAARPVSRDVKIEGSIQNRNTKQIPTLIGSENMRINARIADFDQARSVVIQIGKQIFQLKNIQTNNNKGMFSTLLTGLIKRVGKVGFTLVADYGSSQVRQKGVIDFTSQTSFVPMRDVNKNFREVFGRTPTRREWDKWAKEVTAGITKNNLKARMVAGG